MSDGLNRTLRTLLQALVGVVGAGVLEFYFDLDPRVLAAIGATITVVATAVQNWLETIEVIPTLMKPKGD